MGDAGRFGRHISPRVGPRRSRPTRTVLSSRQDKGTGPVGPGYLLARNAGRPGTAVLSPVLVRPE
jgi:hypothetical protein